MIDGSQSGLSFDLFMEITTGNGCCNFSSVIVHCMYRGHLLITRPFVNPLIYTIMSITTPKDTNRRLVLQVYLGSNTLTFRAICR